MYLNSQAVTQQRASRMSLDLYPHSVCLNILTQLIVITDSVMSSFGNFSHKNTITFDLIEIQR